MTSCFFAPPPLHTVPLKSHFINLIFKWQFIFKIISIDSLFTSPLKCGITAAKIQLDKLLFKLNKCGITFSSFPYPPHHTSYNSALLLPLPKCDVIYRLPII